MKVSLNPSLQPQEQVSERNFYIFGHNISHSLSPTIHNAAFRELKLPHHYSIHESLNIDDSNIKILQSCDFGGASVTFPHKLNIQPHLDHRTESAEKIGAVNTVIAEEVRQSSGSVSKRLLKGDNTDWLGIRNCIQRSHVQHNPQTQAMVIGAGGAARAAVYALQQLGHRSVILVNRTRKTSEKLVADFPSMSFDIIVPDLSQLSHSTQVSIIVACIPADDIIEDDIPNHIFAPGHGVIVEMSYRPKVSALMRKAERHESWMVFGGVDVLKEQAYAQFELWTGLPAPVEAIKKALDENISQNESK